MFGSFPSIEGSRVSLAVLVCTVSACLSLGDLQLLFIGHLNEDSICLEKLCLLLLILFQIYFLFF